MNSKLLFSIIVVLIFGFVGGATYMIFFRNNEEGTSSDIKEYNISNYSYYIENFPSEKYLGLTDSEQIAKEKAESVWMELYGESVKKEKPYKAFFDKSSNTWLVTGSKSRSFFDNTKGGVANIIIQMSDGKVLAVWHEK